MALTLPIVLKGPSLGERHRLLNSLVNEAYNNGDSIEVILSLPEDSTIDHLFKIDIASKHKHLEYILKSLQADDMLFVSRALKSMWLLEKEHCRIINPEYLESTLYPHMITTAVNKMKHWITLHLKDPSRCQEFYTYYSNQNFDYAFKFLYKCPDAVILNIIKTTIHLEKITPRRLRLLCEKTPVVAKLFYEKVIKNTSFLSKYLAHEQDYFNSIKFILKTDPDIFLDIAEERFMSHFKRLNADLTKFVMLHRKDRCMQKQELYITRILNENTVAKYLTSEECENLVITLARAQYLNHERIFTYKIVEPFVKGIEFSKRAAFKKKVFVDKDYGEPVKKWPYVVPKNLHTLCRANEIVQDVFLETEEYNSYDGFGEMCDIESRLLCCARAEMGFGGFCVKQKTLLNVLFDEYRFSSFDKTLFELRKKLRSESSSQNRMFMFLVLISKSGGRSENLVTLFNLLMEYKNEPCQVRAAVVRSLVKRTSIWRANDDIWKSLLTFGRGLGLDGKTAEADCAEGLHAVVIRDLLSNCNCEHIIKTAFLQNFSTLKDYSLTIAEKEHIKMNLLNMLVDSASSEVDVKSIVTILEHAIDTLQAYTLKLDTYPKLIDTIKKVSKNDTDAVKSLMERLFRSKLGRKELFTENFNLIQTDASYVNAIKHDITILAVDKFIHSVVADKRRNTINAEQFLRKMSVYFNIGKEDLAEHFLIAFKEAKLHKSLARPTAFLIGKDLKSYILELDTKGKEHQRFSALLRANAHVARPPMHLDSLEWKKAGAKLIANKIITCRSVDIESIIQKLLTWNRTARLATVLAQRTGCEINVFAAVAKLKPNAAIKATISYYRNQKDKCDPRVWDVIKPLIPKIKNNPHVVANLVKYVDSMPLSILPTYLTEVFTMVKETNFNKSLGLLFRIKANLSKVDENFIKDVLINFVQNRLVLNKVPANEGYESFEYDKTVELYLIIFAKYLLLCTNEELQKIKLQSVGQLYLERLQMFLESKKNAKRFFRYLSVISRSLKYTEVFINDKYVSCLPVMEKFVEWMRGILPVSKYFKLYVPLHLNMLYYKTIRQTALENSGLLEDKQMRNESYKIVGETFGRYVGQEIHILAKSYFDSIVVIYRGALKEYFNNFNRERFRMAPYFIKGLIDTSTGIECIVAIEMFEQIYNALEKVEKNKTHTYLKEKNYTEMHFFYKNYSGDDNWSDDDDA